MAGWPSPSTSTLALTSTPALALHTLPHPPLALTPTVTPTVGMARRLQAVVVIPHTGSKQKEYELSGVQLQAAVSQWQALQSLW